MGSFYFNGFIQVQVPSILRRFWIFTFGTVSTGAGTDLGQWLTRDRSIKQIKALDYSLERALGRISGGLYLITVQKGEVSGAMLASWVTQASLEP